MPISIDLWTFLFQAVNILIVLGVLYKLLYKPLGEILRKREELVENTLSEASSAKEQAEKLMSEYGAKLETSKNEAREILKRAERTGEEMKVQRVEEAQKEAERLLAKAKQDIDNERDQALKAIREEVANMAVQVAENIVRSKISDQDHQRLEKEFLHKVGELQ